MKKITFTLSLILLICTSMFSQDKIKHLELSEIRKNKNQLELDVKNFFNGLSGATIFYKRVLQMGKMIDVSKIKLLRMSGSLNNQITFTEDPNLLEDNAAVSRYFPTDVFASQLALGLEFQKMNKKFVQYYGVDAIVNYDRRKDDYWYAPIANIYNTRPRNLSYESKTIRAGVNPFVGIKYYFPNGLSIGIETGFYAVYFHQATVAYGYEQVVIDDTFVTNLMEETPVKANGVQTRFNNLRYLNIGYIF